MTAFMVVRIEGDIPENVARVAYECVGGVLRAWNEITPNTENSSEVCAGCGQQLPPRNSRGRPRKWCSERCRKGSYGDPCVDCGKRTVYGAEAARVPEPRCDACAREHYRTWTREALICAIQTWAATYGEPPAVADWDGQVARAINDPVRERRGAVGRRASLPGDWPHPAAVRREFGSWAAGLIAAGFTPRVPNGGGGNILRRRDQRAKAAA